MPGIRSAFDVGRDEFEVTGFVPYFRKVVVDFDDLAATTHIYDVPVQANTLVLGVAVVIDTAFAGGTPTIDIGDSSDADGFIDSTNSDLDATKANTTAYSGGITANAFAIGKYYASAGVVRLTGSADLTAGCATLLIHELQFAENWRSLQDIK